MNRRATLIDYLNVLKPKETLLLVYIGACSALVAASYNMAAFSVPKFILTILAITLGSAGANGLTNYLDRDVDALMRRTCNRALPSGHIKPARKVLPLIIFCMIAGLGAAWLLSPVCFVIGLIGILASGILRKTISCTYFGIIAGSAPILISWYAMTPADHVYIMPVLFFCLIAAWTPLHVWTLMIANRSDYEGAGLHYFPLSWEDKNVIRILFCLSIILSIIAIIIYFASGFPTSVYLITCLILSAVMIISNLRLLVFPSSHNSWIVYKYSAFPYLGVIFTAMAVDSLIK